MKTAAVCAAFAAVSCTAPTPETKEASPTGEVAGISYCLPRYVSQQETVTLWEVLTGNELDYGYETFRTHPDKRAGIYFFVMLDYGHDYVKKGTRFILSVDTTDASHPRTFTFTAPEDFRAVREIKLALTGDDCKSPKAKVNAWKLVILDPENKVIARKQSWLWSIKQKTPSGLDDVAK